MHYNRQSCSKASLQKASSETLALNWSTAIIRQSWRLRNKRLQKRGIATVRQGRRQASFSSRNDGTEREKLLNEGVC